MSGRRAPRLIVEVAFLVALSAALAFAGLADPARRAEPEVIEPAPAPARPPAAPRPRPIAPRREPVARRAARHRIDPLAPDPVRGRRFGRRAGIVGGDVDVLDGPPLER